jgi:hypothetical protein
MSEVKETPKLKSFMQSLESQGYLKYGAVIPQSVVYGLLGIVVPAQGTHQEFKDIALQELSAIGYVRSQLLALGMYVDGVQDGYRILLPSENAMQVRRYERSARRKLNCAQKLHRNTPQHDGSMNSDQTEARLMMAQASCRKS